jgi:hypothetical protein
MHGLHIAVPGVLVRMHDVKTAPRLPPSGCGVPELIDPTWALDGGDAVVADAGPVVLALLAEDMNLVACGQLLDQTDRIALGTAATAGEYAVQHGNAQPLICGLHSW